MSAPATPSGSQTPMDRRRFLKTMGATAGLTLLAGTAGFGDGSPGRKMNVLFLGVDDLRPQLGCYGYDQMVTPHIDALAKRGVLFRRAYVQAAHCCPSRASLLTGCRPETTGVGWYTNRFNRFLQDHPSITQHFARHGFYTRTLGKIHHGCMDEPGLSEPQYKSKAPHYLLPEHRQQLKDKHWRRKMIPYEHADRPDSDYFDGQTCDETIATIRRAADQEKPFFISCGFKKPHLPFVCPKKYADLYDPATIKLSAHPDLDATQRAFTIDRQQCRQLGKLMPDISDDEARQLIHSYYACCSFIDAQVGKLVAALKQGGLMDNTIILFWSDHGWHLGDHGVWGKESCFEVATRSPLIVYDPRMKPAVCDALVEFVDFYPTLCDATGVPTPDYVEGDSFVPLLKNPKRPWKTGAFSKKPHSTGYSIRMTDWRYTEWRQRGVVRFQELYHTSEDPLETINLAENPAHAKRVEAMAAALNLGWKVHRPPKG